MTPLIAISILKVQVWNGIIILLADNKVLSDKFAYEG